MLSTKDVIQYLNQHGNVQAIEDMAAFFSVTPRTIRNHLRSVQDAYPACLQVGHGQVKLLKQIPEESSPSAQVPSSQQERSRYILRALLSRSEPMDLDELAASLFILEVTLQNEVSSSGMRSQNIIFRCVPKTTPCLFPEVKKTKSVS